MPARFVLLDPTPGFYKLRLVKHGVWVPCRIFWKMGERDPDTGERLNDDLLLAHIAGQDTTDAASVFAGCHAITESEYDYLIKRRLHKIANDVNAPENFPREAVNKAKLPPIF